jgi:uncharacterized protein
MKNEYLFLAMFLIIINFNAVLAVTTYPTLKPFVNDFGNLITPDQEIIMNEKLTTIEKQTTYEIVVVTVKDTGGQDRLEYANRLGENSGVGKADKDNGLILLWSSDNDKGIAIAVGRGAESTFNDAKVSRIARAARPLFDEGKYSEGFDQMINEIATEINATTVGNNPKGSDVPMDDMTKWIIGIAIFIFVIYIISRIASNASSSGGIFAGSVISTGGGGGGGGFSFGGGSFGGGGGRG